MGVDGGEGPPEDEPLGVPLYTLAWSGLTLGTMMSGTSLAYVVVAVVVIGLGLGFSSTSYLVSVQNAVPWRRRGVATSSVVFFRTVGGSLGVAAMGALLNASLGDRYRAAAERAAAGEPGLARLLSDPNTLLQPAVRSRIPEGAYEPHLGPIGGGIYKPGQKTKGGLKLLG